MEFKIWLAGQIEERKLAQAELARLSKVPQPTIQRILSGETADPRGSTIAKIQRALGFVANELQSITPPPSPLQLVRDPVLDNLDVLEPHEAERWRIRIQAAADERRLDLRAAQEARQQHEESFHRDDKPGDRSPPERSRASN